MHSEIERWAAIQAQLAASRSYWLATTRTDGRPHAMPIWGVWLDGALWFGTGLESVKGRNLARDPRAIVHLESADDAVILEGEARRAHDDAAYAAYSAKYATPADPASFAALPGVGALFAFVPAVVHAWLEPSFATSQVRLELPLAASRDD
jgi:pyridoxine/pyridoxamine 5'-phosphate oxidase